MGPTERAGEKKNDTNRRNVRVVFCVKQSRRDVTANIGESLPVARRYILNS
jgi:hypothetical protein